MDTGSGVANLACADAPAAGAAAFGSAAVVVEAEFVVVESALFVVVESELVVESAAVVDEAVLALAVSTAAAGFA